MTYQEFKNKYNGKYTDFDGYYGPQCWDLAQRYFTEVLNLPSSILSGCGDVKNMLVKPKIDVLLKYFDEVPTNAMLQGDVAIWGGKSNHIAIYDHWDNSNCWYFSQNPNPCKVMIINMSGLRAFRLKGAKNIGYKSHVQKIGWQDWVYDGETSGTTNKRLGIEAIRIDYDKPVYAKAHVEDIGWVDYGKININTIIGTTGKSKSIEALCLKGNFKYRVHIEDFGWSNWTNADGVATLGSVGLHKQIEAIQIIEL